MAPFSALHLAILLFAGVGVAAAAQAQTAKSTNAPDCTSFPCGRVDSIRQTTVKQPWTPLGGGAVSASPGYNAGKVTSAFQIGPGLSNQGIVILGAAGGADYQKRPNSYDQPRWEVTINLDNGQKRVVSVAYEPFVREGDRVRVAGTSLELVE